jgi:hypothetical protein
MVITMLIVVAVLWFIQFNLFFEPKGSGQATEYVLRPTLPDWVGVATFVAPLAVGLIAGLVAKRLMNRRLRRTEGSFRIS